MRFSIITVTLNCERFLAESIESVLQQSYGDYEHIVWDGGSTDGTLEILRSYPHIQLFTGKDSGISDAMNKGAAHCTGDYLLWIHADDRLADPKALEKLALSLEQHKYPGWAYALCANMDESGQVTQIPSFTPFSVQQLRNYNCISHPATCVQRDLFEETGGFDTGLRYCMDYDLWLRLSRLCEPVAFPFVLSHFRQHDDSLSTREQLGVADEAYAVRKRYQKGLWERWKSYRTWKKRRKRALLDHA